MFVLAMGFTASADSHAQTVRGRVLAPDSSIAPAGVLVLLADSGGRIVERVLTHASGEFRLHSAVAGTFHLRALRIGYRPTVSQPIVLDAGKQVSVDLVLQNVPITLAAVAVEDVARCAPSDASTGFAPWDEARKGLEIALLSRTTPFVAEVMRYERRTEARGGRVTFETAQSRSGSSFRPFASEPARALDSLGYVRRDGDGVLFFAPDETVLLSPEFGASHCFRATRGSSDDLVLAFEPIPDRRTPDITGTITLARATGALKRVDFKYVNAPRDVPVDGAGGFLEFQGLPTGDWIVRRWAIRTPLYRRVIHRTGRIFGGGVEGQAVDALVLDQYQETGGEVLGVVLGDQTIWQTALPSLAGVITDGEGTAAAAALVFIASLDRSAVTDASGRFTLERVPAGNHELLVRTTFMDSLGLTGRSYDVRAGERLVRLTLPSRTTLLAEVCRDMGGNKPDYPVALIRGRVVDSHDQPVPNVKVFAEWFQPVGRQVVGATVGAQRNLTTLTDGAGSFALCGVLQDQRIHLRVERGSTPLAHDEIYVKKGQSVVLTTLTTQD